MSSDLDTTVESLDHPVDNAPVRSLVHKGLTVEGYSRAAVQTYWRIPELKLGFDLGGQPWSFMSTPTWFLSHTHLDHIASLPVYVARRRMMKMEPPTIYLPAEAIDAVEMLLRAFQKLDRGRLPVKLVGVVPGQEIELSRELVVKTFATKHTIPSIGYLVYERRRKLKPEYHDLSGEEIRDIRLSGVEVSTEIRLPKVAYLGDTAPAGLDALPDLYQAEIIILEMTFVAPGERPSLIHKYGHTHLDDIIARADRFENEVIIASHFSTRLHPDQIQRIVDKRLPDCLRGRLKVWL
ncbi:ribonuclease Z [Singulisphaera sp. GP187]|uniref:MBL fold metallo-hydrolase n=1 Tax=Singulisphaera sp. GP187 TaxID=1882752 RepID=UPI000926AEF4|nr:MBL fold metallo-hydrolase [Singulisphaera sp. GP187]SIO61064.1 ribonuclease Z [Singulisphaera sp. GP187]